MPSQPSSGIGQFVAASQPSMLVPYVMFIYVRYIVVPWDEMARYGTLRRVACSSSRQHDLNKGYGLEGMTWIGTFCEILYGAAHERLTAVSSRPGREKNEHCVTTRVHGWLETDDNGFELIAVFCSYRYSRCKNREFTPASRPRQGQHIYPQGTRGLDSSTEATCITSQGSHRHSRRRPYRTSRTKR